MNEKLLRREDLDPVEESSMFTLFARHFSNVTREQFQSDLNEKGWVLLLERDGTIGGFSTLDIYDVPYRGTPVSVVYSGDTIVDSSVRASSSLSRAWIGAVNCLRRELGKDRLWWLLIVSGFRTYRFLPTYWRRFHPCPGEDGAAVDAPSPSAPDLRDLMHHLAMERFGDRFDPERGIVRLDPPQTLREELRGIPPRRLRDPHVAFFAERNPGHERGDELVCLTELSRDNLTPAGRRMWDLGERVFAGRGVGR